MKKILLVILAILMMITMAACGGETGGGDAVKEKTELVFADVDWDSIKLNNALAGLVAESVFGYTWTEIPGSTPICHEALMNGEIDVHMEEWTDNIPAYRADLEAGKFTELGINYNDNRQGFYIPRYIADENPGLKTVKDLKNYMNLFPDPEDSSKGIIYGGIPGWEATEIMGKKVEAYGLDEYYNYVLPGSAASLSAAIISAWDKQEPIVAYYWEPTWLLGRYDFVILEDDPYDLETYQDGVGACPSVTVTVAVSNDFAASNPEYCEFLSKFSVSSSIINEALAYREDTGADYVETAKWLLKEAHPELIGEWLSDEQASALQEAL